MYLEKLSLLLTGMIAKSTHAGYLDDNNLTFLQTFELAVVAGRAGRQKFTPSFWSERPTTAIS